MLHNYLKLTVYTTIIILACLGLENIVSFSGLKPKLKEHEGIRQIMKHIENYLPCISEQLEQFALFMLTGGLS